MASPRNNHPRSLAGMFEEFVHSEVFGSLLLLVCTVVALAWANSPWAGVYDDILHTKIGLSWGGATYALSVHHWINDALMVVFFFVVGLEVKRELVVGQLSSMKQAMLPISAAAGGMLVPAVFYAVLNLGGEGTRGWGIPMATDIAFALGVLAVFGQRVPLALKVFITAAAIADDIGAVLVIAVFYTETIHVTALVAAAVFLGLLIVATRVLHIRRLEILLPLIVGVWIGVFASGVHATVAGIIVAMVVPVRARIDPKRFLGMAEDRLAQLRPAASASGPIEFDRGQIDAVADLHRAAGGVQSPALVLEHYLHPVQSFFVLPLFALANAGVSLGADFFSVLTGPIALGIILGLVAGKQLGIAAFSWAAVRWGGACLPEGVNWRQVYGAGCLAGIGFTMSLFISELAFPGEPELVAQAKIGILVASLISGIMGTAILHHALPKEPVE